MSQINEKLPTHVKQRVLDYVLLEVGASDNSKLSLEDLGYEGELLLGGIVSHCWRVASLSNDFVVALEIDGAGDFHYTTICLPSSHGDYKSLNVEVESENVKRIVLDYNYYGDDEISSLDDEEILLSNEAGSIIVSSEIYFATIEPKVTINIIYAEEMYIFHGRGGLSINMPFGDTSVLMEVGDMDRHR